MEKFIFLDKTLADIEDYVCEGYYWMSDQENPTVLYDKPLKAYRQDWESKLPFIIEGNFYCRKDNLSIMYKHIDGKPLLRVVELKKVQTHLKKCNPYKGIPFQDSHLDFKMCEIWEEVKDTDNLMEGMTNLQPLMSVFAGFNQEKNA